jgi:hypothetical protein
MCTYQTEQVALTGSAKGAGGWFSLSSASVYFDHPVHAGGEHTLNIDFINPPLGAASRVAVELAPGSARDLAYAILAAADAAEALTGPALPGPG